MATDMQKFFSGHNLPSREALAKSLMNFAAAKNTLTGKALLRMNKDTGKWVFGVDNTPLPDNTHVVGNPASLSSGYVAWWLGKIEGEVMQPLALGPVDATRLAQVNSGGIPPGKTKPSGNGWEDQVSIDLISRDEVPLSLLYKTSTLGGKKAVLGLAQEIAVGMVMDSRRVYPIIELSSYTYQHPEYGVVYNPVLAIVGWLDDKGEEVPELTQLTNEKNDLL